MALVSKIESVEKERHSVHEPTKCYSFNFSGPDGQPYLQLETDGSKNRVHKGKPSQTIQFDREGARQLLQALLRAFPDLRRESGSGSGDKANSNPSDADDEADEGRVFLRLHRLRERDPRLAGRKKRAVIAKYGRLRCEACDFDFEMVYGALGRGFAECHHIVPLASSTSPVRTRLNDLSIVCSNCHRMLHRRPFRTIQELRSIVQDGRSSNTVETPLRGDALLNPSGLSD